MTSYELPDYVTPHDGSQPIVPEHEQALVSQKLESLIDDLMLQHTENVWHNGFANEDTLSLKVPDGSTAQNSYWAGIVMKKTEGYQPSGYFSPSEYSVKEVYFQKIVDDDGHDQFAYRLYGDGIVRRWDGSDVIAKIREQRELGIEDGNGDDADSMSWDERADAAWDLFSTIAFEAPNDRLERLMGLNEQPVSLAEIDGLIDMVTQPGVVPRY